MANKEIEFHRKKMGMLEARAYLIGLNLGIVDVKLNEEEQMDYLRWRDFRNNRNELSKITTGKKIFKNINERVYLMENLENTIESVKIARKREYCNTYGHKEKKGEDYCARCGAMYDKNKPLKKEDNLSKTMYNPFSP